MTIKEYMLIKALHTKHDGDSKLVVNELLKINKDLKLKEANKKLLHYLEDLSKKQETLIQRFHYEGVEYGLIPDFEEMLTSEYIDIDKYERDENNIHRLMAVLYRPIINIKGDKYDIEPYTGTSKYSDIMLGVDVKVYHSVLSFFLTLNEILLKDSLESMKQKNKKLKQPQTENA